jgi:hypothetical protein
MIYPAVLETTVNAGSAAKLQLRRHVGSDCHSEAWLAEVAEMRGCVLYQQGRRPSFLRSDGSFDDADPIDLNAYHILARLQGRLVGCARIVLLKDIESAAVSSTIGELWFRDILRDLGTTRERACEASRWTVVPECRGELGRRLVVTSWAVARWLDVEVAFVLAGTRQKQDLALIRMGARAIHGLPLFPSDIFDDELRLLYFDVLHPSQSMLRQMFEAAALLNPACVVSPNASAGSPPADGLRLAS